MPISFINHLKKNTIVIPKYNLMCLLHVDIWEKNIYVAFN